MQAEPRVVATGFDTVHYTASLQPPRDLVKELGALKELAQQGQPAIKQLDGEAFTVGPKSAGRWTWRLVGPSAVVLVTDNPKQDVKCKVELGSLANWSQGSADAIARSRRFVCELFGGIGNGWPAKVSRLDLAVDFQGWNPSLAMRTWMVTRARRRRDYLDGTAGCARCGFGIVRGSIFCRMCGQRISDSTTAAGPRPRTYEPLETLNVETFYSRQLFTGLRWGTRKPIQVRLYDKTQEILSKSPDKAWFAEVWSASDGYQPGERVWRLEVETHRQLLGAIRLKNGGELDLVEHAVEHAASLWRYLVGAADRECTDCGGPVKQHWRSCRACSGRVKRQQGWVELREVLDENERPTRCPVHPVWRTLQSVAFDASAPAAPMSRAIKRQAEELVLAQMIVGCLSSMGARRHAAKRLDELRAREGREPSPSEVYDVCAELAREVALDEGLLTGGNDRPGLLERLVVKTATVGAISPVAGGGGRTLQTKAFL